MLIVCLYWKLNKNYKLKKKGDDYTTGCLLDYIYFKNYYKIIAIDLSKQQALDPQQTNFTANLDRAGNKRFHFILEEAKETVFEFS